MSFGTSIHDNVDVQVLATALNVYATTASLGGIQGQAAGFEVTATGLGADSIRLHHSAAAFGVADRSELNVFELLKTIDRQTVSGVIDNAITACKTLSKIMSRP
jgi:hypothetical protein